MRSFNILVLLLSFLPIANAGAQEVFGNLQGRVLGADGTPLPAASVTLSSSGLQRPRGAVTGDDGTFHLLALPVGNCTVTIRALGHRTVIVDSVRIQLGATTSLEDVRMETEAIELPEVVVSGARARIDPTTATLGTNLERRTIQPLPTERNFRSVVALAPEVDAESVYGGDDTRISGGSGYGTVYFMDGVNVTDPHGNLSTVNLPPDFLQEVDIKAGGYEAEFGRAQSGIVNLVTQSGGNDFHGRVFGFYTSDRLTGEARVAPGGVTAQNLTKYDGGFSLGGRIIRNRLWFFGAYDPGLITSDHSIPGFGFQQDRQWSHVFSAKLNWQAAPATNVVLTAVGDPGVHKFIDQPQLNTGVIPTSSTTLDPYLARIAEGSLAVSLKALHVTRRQLLIEGTLSRVRQDFDVGSDGGQSGPLYADAQTGAYSGGYPYVFHNPGTRSSASLSVSSFLRRHSIKVGAEYDDNELSSDFTIGPFVVRYDDTTYGLSGGRSFGTAHVRYPVIYAQDGWLATDRLRINAGLRWDALFFGVGAKTVLRIPDQIGPRLGFVYQPGKLGTQKLSASYGRFYEEMPTAVYLNYFVPGRFVFALYDHNPLVDPAGGDTLQDLMSANANELGRIRGQHFDEFTLGYERLLPARMKLTLRGMYRVLRDVVDDAPDLSTGQYLVGNPGRNPLEYTGRPLNEYSALGLVLEGSAERTPGWLVSYRWSRAYGNYDTGTNLSYQYDVPEMLPYSTGLLPNDRTHVLKCYGSYVLASGFTGGAVLTWESGTPVSELGGTSLGGHYSFLRNRGSVGHTPATWNLDLRFSYAAVEGARASAFRPTVTLDVYHVAGARRVTRLDEVHFTGVDAAGNQVGENPDFLQPTQFQEPMAARLGLSVAF